MPVRPPSLDHTCCLVSHHCSLLQSFSQFLQVYCQTSQKPPMPLH